MEFFASLDGPDACEVSQAEKQKAVLANIPLPPGSDLRVRLVEGECIDGVISGPAVLRWHLSIPGGPGTKRTDFVDGHSSAVYENASVAGLMESWMRVQSVTETKKLRPIFSVSFVRVKGGEVIESTEFSRSKFGLMTILQDEIEPGLLEQKSYVGDQLSVVLYRQEGVTHGTVSSYHKGKLTSTLCYFDGKLVADELCDGPRVNGRRVSARREPAANEVAARKLTNTSKPATSNSAPTAESKSQSQWPTLANLMVPAGGGEKDAAVIVGIEDYAFVSDVPGASMNAKDWYRYFTRVRKTAASNVKLLLNNDATDDGIKSALSEMSKRTGTGGKLWFIFIGHGAPAEDGKDGMIVGVDAQQSAQGLYGRSVKQAELIALANAGSHDQSVFVIDACFSGRSGDGSALAAGLQPLLPVAKKATGARTVVFTAGRADQFAGPLPHLDRPAFSYLFLGSMLGWGDANGDGWVSSEEAIRFSDDTLRAVLNGRNQNPEHTGAHSKQLGKSAGATAPDITEIVLAN